MIDHYIAVFGSTALHHLTIRVVVSGKPNGYEQVVQIYDLSYQFKHPPLHGASALFCWSELCMLVWLHTGSQKSISQAQSAQTNTMCSNNPCKCF